MKVTFIRGQLLNHFAEAVGDLGYDPSDVFERCGFSPASLELDQLVPTEEIEKLFETAKELTGCSHLGLLCARNTQLEDYGALGQLSRVAPTLGVAIREAIAHLKVNASDIHRELHIEGDVAWLSHGTDSGRVQSPELAQIVVASNWRFNNLVTRNRWNPRFIAFEYEAPDDAAFYRGFFSTPVQFGSSFTGVAFERTDLELPLPDYDPLIYRALTQYLETIDKDFPEDFLDSVRWAIARQLNSGHCSIDAVAHFFPYDKRALQRRLKEHGTSYQEVLDNLRFEQALDYLKTSDRSISRISESLGYKNSSIFSKVFKRRYGVSPKQWQKREFSKKHLNR